MSGGKNEGEKSIVLCGYAGSGSPQGWKGLVYGFYDNVLSAGRTDQAVCSYSYGGQRWTPFGESVNLRFTLDIFTGCRVGLFCYGTVQTGGTADFREFRFSDKDSKRRK